MAGSSPPSPPLRRWEMSGGERSREDLVREGGGAEGLESERERERNEKEGRR